MTNVLVVKAEEPSQVLQRHCNVCVHGLPSPDNQFERVGIGIWAMERTSFVLMEQSYTESNEDTRVSANVAVTHQYKLHPSCRPH